jgi:subtilisin family serine protease
MKLYLLLALSFFITSSFSQSVTPTTTDNPLKSWYLKDKSSDGFSGISLNKAYTYLKGKKGVPVIVGVIDSGIDTLHEDLKASLWTNPKEIPGNGKDDDGNGYPDDVHGWNFLGGKDGTEAEKASSEKARVYHQYKSAYENKKIDTNKLAKPEVWQYNMWKRAEAEIEPNPEITMQLTGMQNIAVKIAEWDSIISKEANKKEYTSAELEAFTFETDAAKKAKMGFLNLMKALPFGAEVKNSFIMQTLKEEIGKMKDDVEAKETAPIDVHNTIIKDNYQDFNDKFYGNTNIMGKGSMHGTHVSGIIAATRNNGVGIDGIADNAKIMVIRAVPDGDEYDKDIALAIRYAVDNGAKVINMSFGKSYSPQKYWVDEAYKYAASKDVLLVHAAGNDNKNVDSSFNYPSVDFLQGGRATNVITVGASADTALIGTYVSGFSNYGKKNVDVFAPGSQIYSSLPGGNVYGFLDGTSMASPVVAGIAALIRSYFPDLSAVQTKQAIEESVVFLDKKSPVFLPGTENQTSMSILCKTGGIVNAYQAVLKAEQLSKKIKKKK